MAPFLFSIHHKHVHNNNHQQASMWASKIINKHAYNNILFADFSLVHNPERLRAYSLRRRVVEEATC